MSAVRCFSFGLSLACFALTAYTKDASFKGTHYELCSMNGEVIPSSDGDFGVIRNTHSRSNALCNITIPKPSGSAHRFAVIEGIDAAYGDRCPDYNLTILTRSFCISPAEFNVFNLRNIDQISINAVGNIPPFNISYFSTVFVCNGIPQSANWTVLSGYVSSDPPSTNIRTSRVICTTTVRNLPPNTSVRFEAKDFRYTGGSDRGYAVLIGDNSRAFKKNDVVLRNTDSEGEIRVKTIALSWPEEDDQLRFNYKYTVLQCDVTPDINRTLLDSITSDHPYLPGTVAEYQCIQNYQFKADSTISCQVNEMSKAAEWTGAEMVQCKPAPWCVNNPETLPNTFQTAVSVNRTISYRCDEGYESDGQKSVNITCISIDEDNIPWTWNDTDINEQLSCQPVRCNLSEIYNISNGRLDNLTRVYRYGDTVDYNCDGGFTKTVTKNLRCLSDKSWSAVPLCEEALCQPLSSILYGNFRKLNNKESSSYSAGTLLLVKCAEGYKVEGEDVIMCHQGDWRSIDQESLKGIPTCVATSDPRVPILGSILGVVCAALVAGAALAAIKIRRLNVSSKESHQTASKSRPISNDGRNNKMEYEDVAAAPSQLNPTFIPDQPRAGATTYENTQIRTGGAAPEYVQIIGGEYEMVNKGDSRDDQHMYTSLDN